MYFAPAATFHRGLSSLNSGQKSFSSSFRQLLSTIYISKKFSCNFLLSTIYISCNFLLPIFYCSTPDSHLMSGFSCLQDIWIFHLDCKYIYFFPALKTMFTYKKWQIWGTCIWHENSPIARTICFGLRKEKTVILFTLFFSFLVYLFCNINHLFICPEI